MEQDKMIEVLTAHLWAAAIEASLKIWRLTNGDISGDDEYVIETAKRLYNQRCQTLAQSLFAE